jgi:hypothetical protein
MTGDDACARLASGEVACWNLTELGDQPVVTRRVPGMADAAAISTGTENNLGSVGTGSFCAERRDGSLWCWTLAPAKIDAKRVLEPGSVSGPFVGGSSGCFIQRDHRAACWGHNGGGRLGDGSIIHLDTPVAVPGL